MQTRRIGPSPVWAFLLSAACVSVGFRAAAGEAEASAAYDESTLREQASANVRDAFRGCRDLDFTEYPIGVFDSGTGGLAVLEKILDLDTFDNRTKAYVPGGDGRADFAHESFIYLADQANMPYGNYPSVGKRAFLEDLIVKDAEFLLGNRYFAASDAPQARHDKIPVKAVVIACNTATAYGKDDIEELITAAALDVQVVGVIDAGAKGAVEVFADGKSGAIGVIATRGTVLSDAYPRTIRAQIERMGFEQHIDVVQQGAFGLAGAIDGVPEYIVAEGESRRPRKDYQGPSLKHPFARIDSKILNRYGFNFANNRMLLDGSSEQPRILQLNSVENYIAYHLVTLLENLRRMPDPRPLRAIVLGCTHFPYFADAFRDELQRLYEYSEEGQYVYRMLLAPKVELIDPGYLTARRLHAGLVAKGRMDRTEDDPGPETRCEFYISVPSAQHPEVKVNAQGGFTYDYKYGRKRGEVGADYRVVPLRRKHLGEEGVKRLRGQLPWVWQSMDDFHQRSKKSKMAVIGTAP
jgi:glutamate racemase